MMRTYKLRLYPRPEQAQALEAWLGSAATLYNSALQTYRDPWERNRRHRYRFWDSQKEAWVWRDARPPVKGRNPDTWGGELTDFRREHPELLPEGMPAHVQHEVLGRVKKTIAAMGSRAAAGKKAGTPRYRSSRRYDSLTFQLTTPSRPPPERDEEWLAAHADDLEKCIEYIVDQVQEGRAAIDVKAKELKALVGGSLDAARSLRVLALTYLDYEVPPGITVGAGALRQDALHLAGLGTFPLLHRRRRRGAQQKRRVAGLRRHREIPHDAIPRSVVVRRSCGRWYACVVLELPDPPPRTEDRPGPHVGIDLGVITWLTGCSEDQAAVAATTADLARQNPAIRHTSEGGFFRVEGAKAGERHAKRVRRWQRTVARRTRRGHAHSQRRRKAVAAYARACEAERQQRADHRHKVTAVIARHFGVIGMEDLGVKDMTKEPRNENEADRESPARLKEDLNRRILDQAWYTLRLTAYYKAEGAGGTGRTMPRNEPSTSKCSACGGRVPMPPLMRWFKCPHCGCALPRTYNSARNVLRWTRAGVEQERPDGAHPSGIRASPVGLRTGPSPRLAPGPTGTLRTRRGS